MTRGVRPGDSDVSAAIDHDPVGLVLDRLHGAGCNPKQASSGQWNAKCPVSANHNAFPTHRNSYSTTSRPWEQLYLARKL